MDTRQIIDYAMDDNAKEMREALYASIYDRVAAAFEQKRIEVAGSMLGMPLSTEETVYEEKEKEKEDKEEVEQIDELSKGTLDSYLGKSIANRDKHEDDIINTPMGSHDNTSKSIQKLNQRKAGIALAVKKMNKEDVEDCEKVAKKEVKKHEKSMHGEQY